MKEFDWEKFSFIALCSFMGAALLASLLPLAGYSGKAMVILSKLPEPILMLNWIALICGIVGLLGYAYYNNLLKKDRYSNEEGSFYDQKEKRIKIVKTFSGVCSIFTLIVLGLPESNDLPGYFEYILWVNILICCLGVLANNSLIKRVRPELEEDLTGFGLDETYFEKLDEREKEKAGRASYKTMNLMGFAYLSVFFICFVWYGNSQVSSIICVTVGVLWLFQTVTMLYYSCKEK